MGVGVLHWKLRNFAIDGIPVLAHFRCASGAIGLGIALLGLPVFLVGLVLLSVDLPSYNINYGNNSDHGRGLILIWLGVLDEYIGRIFNEAKQRPRCLVR